MKAQIIINLQGKFTEEDIKADTESYRRDVENSIMDNDNSKVSNFSVGYKIIKKNNKFKKYKGFKRHFCYGEEDWSGKSIADSWRREESDGYDLIDLRDTLKGKEVELSIYLRNQKAKHINFDNRKEGLAYIKKEFGLK